MNIYFPRNDELLASMLKHSFELVEVKEHSFKIYVDVDVYQNIRLLSKVPCKQVTYDKSNGWLSFEGIVDRNELAHINQLELKGNLLCEEKTHTHLLALRGFFGDDMDEDYPIKGDHYWVKYAVNEEWGDYFFKTQILPQLKEIRLKSLFQ